MLPKSGQMLRSRGFKPVSPAVEPAEENKVLNVLQEELAMVEALS